MLKQPTDEVVCACLVFPPNLELLAGAKELPLFKLEGLSIRRQALILQGLA
jgi:hypothetical protein